MALLLQMADAMFPEGQGAPRAMAKVDAAAEKSNELLVNAKEAGKGFCECSEASYYIGCARSDWIPPDLPYISGPGGQSSIDWA
jgi:hypothetical protein